MDTEVLKQQFTEQLQQKAKEMASQGMPKEEVTLRIQKAVDDFQSQMGAQKPSGAQYWSGAFGGWKNINDTSTPMITSETPSKLGQFASGIWDIASHPWDKVLKPAVQGVASLPLTLASTVATPIAGAITQTTDLLGLSDNAYDRFVDQAKKGIDYGFMGTYKGIGTDVLTKTTEGAKPIEEVAPAIINTLLDTTSVGLETASYMMSPIKGFKIPFVGEGVNKTLTEFVKEGTIGSKGFWATVRNSPFEFTKNILRFGPSALTYGGSVATKDLAQGKDLQTALEDAGASAAGFITGISLLGGGINVLANWGGRLMKNEITKGFFSKMGDVVQTAREMLPSGTQESITGIAEKKRNFLQRQYELNLKGGVDSLVKDLTAPVGTEAQTAKMFRDLVQTNLDEAYINKSSLYNQVLFDPNIKFTPGTFKTGAITSENPLLKGRVFDNEFQKSVAEAQAFLVETSKMGETQKPAIPKGYEGVNFDRAKVKTATGESSPFITTKERPSPLRDYMMFLRSQMEKENSLLVNDRTAMVEGEKAALNAEALGDNGQAAEIRKIYQSLRQNNLDYLRKNFPEQYAKLEQAGFKNLEIKNDIDSNLSQKMRSAHSFETLVEDILNGNYRFGEVSKILDAFAGEQGAMDVFSQILMNQIVKRIVMERTSEGAAKFLTKTLD